MVLFFSLCEECFFGVLSYIYTKSLFFCSAWVPMVNLIYAGIIIYGLVTV